jgi:predicted GH43/DUF377 family glycosyl hydrolase
MNDALSSLATRTSHHLVPDASRVFTRLFVAGREDYGSSQSRASVVIDRVLALTNEEVHASLEDVNERFGGRHDDLDYWLDLHAHRVANRLDPEIHLSDERWRLIGAFFTHEFSIEGAALTNPSVVLHPDQTGVADGSARFVMSVRCIGEGHRSSIGFRTGVIDQWGGIVVDTPRSCLNPGLFRETQLRQSTFRGLSENVEHYGENARFVLGELAESFSHSELEEQLTRLLHSRDTYRNAEDTVRHFRSVADRSYSVTYPADIDISERVLWPYAPAEWRGMEDARFVRFTTQEGYAVYYATYTAFDGNDISQQLLATTGFTTFKMYPMSGPAAAGKGLALFPRKVGGRYVALSRADHESNYIAFSDHLEYWAKRELLQAPTRPWELIQIGNCGSPIETEAGWLVLTHAVGPMRTYCISALLLDIHDPTRVIGSLDTPLLSPTEKDRDGYVPNVVYSCGSMLHGESLMIPFGIADNSIGIAVANINEVLERLTTKDS